MGKVAGYSARFVDLTDEEKDETIARTSQRLVEGRLLWKKDAFIVDNN